MDGKNLDTIIVHSHDSKKIKIQWCDMNPDNPLGVRQCC